MLARLLDVLVHQLPADAPLPHARGTRPTGTTGSSSSASTRPSSRSSATSGNVEAAVDRLDVRLSRRARQRLRHLERVGEPLLAGLVLHRPARARPLRPLRRRRVRGEGGRDPAAPRRARARRRRSPARSRRPPPWASRRPRPTSATSASTASTAPRSSRIARPSTRCRTSLPPNGLAYGGRWTVEGERIVAGEDARLRLRYRARSVHLVLGTVTGLRRPSR